MNSPNMQPYVRFATAAIGRTDLRPPLEEIARLPLEKRYVWRVVSALKCAFADFNSLGIVLDRDFLKPEDQTKLQRLLDFRPVQFCLFLKALVGEEAMEKMMTAAITQAKQTTVGHPTPPG